MARKRFKPKLDAICKIGTVAHNRPFTAGEFRQYAGAGGQTMAWLKKHALIRSVEGRKWYPTAKGWKMIEKACSRRMKA